MVQLINHDQTNRLVEKTADLTGKTIGWLRLAGSLNYWSLLQNVVSFLGLIYKRDL